MFLAVVSASALIIDVCLRLTGSDGPALGGVQGGRAAGWGHKLAPTCCVRLTLPRKATQGQKEAKKHLQYVWQHFTGLYSASFSITAMYYLIILVQIIANIHHMR